MPNQNSVQDDNQFPSMLVHSGTAGTAETRKVTSQNTPGAVDVHVVGGTTTSTLPDPLGSVVVTNGTFTGGTSNNVVSGTQQTLGTVGVINNIVTGTINRINNGSIVVVGFVQSQLGTLGALTSGTVISGTYSYMNFSAAGTTTLKTGAGILHSFVINTKSVGGAGTLFDNTAGSGTVIAVVDTTLSTTAFIYDLGFSNLTYAWAGNTGGNVTITYK